MPGTPLPDSNPHRDLPPSAASSEPQWVEPAPVDVLPPVAASTLPAHIPRADSAPEFQPTKAGEDTPEVSFMRHGSKPSIWRKPVVRTILLLLVLLLVAVLAAQFLRHERDRIVSMEPSTRPVLAALCAWSGCELAPLRQIESIIIDSSSFSRIRGDNYRLAFSIKNNAALAVALPAMELALTDGQDQAVVRRVITPADFGAASPVLAAGSDWSGSLSLSVKATPNVDRFAGYRLIAFYP